MPEEGGRPPISLIVVTALKDEAVTFCQGAGASFFPVSLSLISDFLSEQRREVTVKVPVIYTGPGPKGLPKLESLFFEERVRKILFCGFAGGLAPFIGSGEIVVGLQVLRPGHPPEPIDPPEFLFSRYRTGAIVSVDCVVSSQEEKRILRTNTGGDLVDMESAQWIALSRKHCVSAWVVRVISDSACDVLPHDLLEVVDEKGETSIVGFLKGMVRRPSLLISLLRIGPGLARAHFCLKDLGRVVAAHVGLFENLEDSF